MGIGTATPSAPLEISASSVGLNFPNVSQIQWDFDAAIYGANNSLIFRTNANTERMRIDSAGNVGIGMASPAYPLDISTSNTGLRVANQGATNSVALSYNQLYSYGTPLYINHGGNNVFLVSGGSGNVGINTTDPAAKLQAVLANDTDPSTIYNWDNRHVMFGQAGSYGGGVAISYNSTVGYGVINAMTPGVAWRNLVLQTGGGNVGIGTTSPGAYKLNVAGTLYTSGGCTGCSDQRWKKDVAPIGHALTLVDKLQGVQFNWRADEFPERQFPKSREIGFIAQEVEQVLPEIVYEDGGYKFIHYDKLTAVHTEAIKELKTLHDAEVSRTTALEAENTALQQRLERLEQRLQAVEAKR